MGPSTTHILVLIGFSRTVRGRAGMMGEEGIGACTRFFVMVRDGDIRRPSPSLRSEARNKRQVAIVRISVLAGVSCFPLAGRLS